MKIEDLYAKICESPLTHAFTIEEKKTLPSIHNKKMFEMPAWNGGSFETFAQTAYLDTAEKPLALYVHIPFCHHRCTFCPFYINKTYDTFSKEYATLLSKEIESTAQTLQGVIKQRSVQTIYFGGGTPSDMEAEDLAKIIRQLHNTFNIAKDAEITVEGRVRDFTAEKAKAWVEAGANRFSVGVQTTDTQLRKKLSRQSGKEEIAETLNGLCASGGTVVVDIMYGLPGQTPEMLVEDVRFLAEETGIHGLDLYELKVFPDSALEKAILKGTMPAAASIIERAEMFGKAYAKLLSYGFENFSARHWRRDEKERSIYNSLAKKQTDMIPFGSGGGGRLGSISLANNSNVEEYAEEVNAGVKPLKRIMKTPAPHGDSFARQIADSLENIRIPTLERWPEKHRQSSEKIISQWQKAGLLTAQEDEDGILLTQAGVFWAAHMSKLLSQYINASS